MVFAVLFFALWRLCPKTPSVRWILLVLASFVFYGWWDWRFLFLLIFNGLIDYYAALGIENHPGRKKLFLTLSIAGNIGALAVFKYAGFVLENLNGLFALLHLNTAVPVITLPMVVGISFYTFQSMSYTIDVYRGEMKPTRNIFHFFAYLSMFPQLVAGPIIRASYLLPQLLEHRNATPEEKWEGTRLVVHGYFKKVVVADNIAPVVNLAFAQSDMVYSSPYWWVIMTLFAFQIYCDFSGYSDIARGLARWMGYDFPLNFNHPYIASGFQEFWQRWHISLSTWFRDYVYVPLGGNKNKAGKPSLVSGLSNMWITMVISGLWHGAAWNFLIWGALHSFYLTLERLTSWPSRLKQIPFGRFFTTTLGIMQVWVAWVFFRAETFTKAISIVGVMFNVGHLGVAEVLALK